MSANKWPGSVREALRLRNVIFRQYECKCSDVGYESCPAHQAYKRIQEDDKAAKRLLFVRRELRAKIKEEEGIVE